MNHDESPLVSVVIPCYNHENFVQDCIQSVIDQSYENIELIIIDDGSKDNSVIKIQEMVELCRKRFFRFEFRHRPNEGLSSTLNEALDWCQGDYYSAIASDDMMLKDKTKNQIQFMEKNKNIVAVFGGVKLIDENNLVIGDVLKKEKKYCFKEIIMHEHNLPAPTQMIRMGSLKNVGGYNSDILIEDWYMWIKLSELGDLFYMNKLFCLYRQHENNISKKIKIIQNGRLDVLSHFKDSIYYQKAFKKIERMNNIEDILMSDQVKFVKIIHILILSPLYSISLILNKLK